MATKKEPKQPKGAKPNASALTDVLVDAVAKAVGMPPAVVANTLENPFGLTPRKGGAKGPTPKKADLAEQLTQSIEQAGQPRVLTAVTGLLWDEGDWPGLRKIAEHAAGMKADVLQLGGEQAGDPRYTVPLKQLLATFRSFPADTQVQLRDVSGQPGIALTSTKARINLSAAPKPGQTVVHVRVKRGDAAAPKPAAKPQRKLAAEAKKPAPAPKPAPAAKPGKAAEVYTIGLEALSNAQINAVVGALQIGVVIDVRGSAYQRKRTLAGVLNVRPDAPVYFPNLITHLGTQCGGERVLLVFDAEAAGVCRRYGVLAPAIGRELGLEVVHVYRDELVTQTELQRAIDDDNDYSCETVPAAALRLVQTNGVSK